MPVQASDHERVKVPSDLVPGRILLHHAGSTVPAIAQDGSSSERGRDKHPDELLQSSCAALRSSVPVQASDHARVKVLSVLVPGRRRMNHTGSTVPTIAQDGPSSEKGRGKHPDEEFQSSGAGRRSTVNPFPAGVIWQMTSPSVRDFN